MNPHKQDADKELKTKIYNLVYNLSVPDKREAAMHELSKLRETHPNSLENILAPSLWYSFGSITSLLHEVVSIYPHLNPPTLKQNQSTRVCNALATLQHVASHKDTRKLFLKGMLYFTSDILATQRRLTFSSSYPPVFISLLKYYYFNQTL